MNSELARQTMVAQQVRVWDVSDQAVLTTLGEVERELFVPASLEDMAYADTEIPLAHGQVMLRPIIEGRLLQALSIQPSDDVLEVGTGSGYLTACLAKLCSSVTSIDLYDDFVAAAKRRLDDSETDNVTLHCMDATSTLPEGDFDAIVVTSAVPRVDERFIQALKPGGRLILVVGQSPTMEVRLITREQADWRAEVLFETDIPRLVNMAGTAEFSF
jgi:protein-L-isoaspartate(D-aspartate) O-methyltransferase